MIPFYGVWHSEDKLWTEFHSSASMAAESISQYGPHLKMVLVMLQVEVIDDFDQNLNISEMEK